MTKQNPNLSSAVFDTHDAADRAIRELKAAGASNDNISVVAHDDGDITETDGSGAEAAKDIVGKGALGGGIGALLGVAALAIPGVGPLVGAGAIAAAAAGGAAVTGTAVGVAVGAIAGALEDHGVSKDDADYYERELKNGGVMVSVDPDHAKMTTQQANEILARSGGHSSTIRRMS